MSALEALEPLAVVVPPSGSDRLFAAGEPGYHAHLARFGVLPAVQPQALIEEVEAAGLTGRGGAAFPVWRKLAAAAGGSGAVVIANGAEGEPASAKDEILLTSAPHLVIDGLLLAASAVGARELYLYAGAAQLAAVSRALAERRDAGRITLREAPDTFISGEASAVVNSIGRRVALPTDHPVRLTTAGLRGRPTLVQNVETLAHLALVARFGSRWFRSAGTKAEPGTRLVTVSSEGSDRIVIEAAAGMRLDELLLAAGRDADDVEALLVGGYHGGWLPARHLGTALGTDALQPFGAAPGAGVLFVLPLGRCGLRASARIATYLAGQSARQCGPCVNGLPAMASLLNRLATDGREQRLPQEVRRLAALVQGRGACHHPDGTARFVLSSLAAFEAEVDLHRRGRCREDLG
jgi:NADH:ubiquinone oxidoreductase subunit F (NADH-binding)